jgi:hypothetical protein
MLFALRLNESLGVVSHKIILETFPLLSIRYMELVLSVRGQRALQIL